MFPTLIRLGPLHLATYGVLVSAAYLLGVLWLKSQRERMGLDEDTFWGAVYAVFLGAIIGGKLMFILLNWRLYASGQMSLIGDFRYGFVFYGGFIAGALGGVLYGRWKGFDVMAAADYFGVAIPAGHWLGRLGCLAAGCCYGRPTSMPWGIRFTRPDSLVEPDLLGVPLHPTQLYEAAGDLLIAAVLFKLLHAVQRGEVRRGTVFLGYFILYGVLRFLVECFRGDDRGGSWLGLSPSQLAALGSVALAGVLIWRRGFRETAA